MYPTGGRTYGGGSWTSIEPLTGLQYGRVVINRVVWGFSEVDGITIFRVYRDIYIDIFFIAFTLAAAAIAIAATHYLLKKRVSLQ